MFDLRLNTDTAGTLSDSGLAALRATDGVASSRGFFLELVGNLIVFIICTLVCLQVLAGAQVSLDKSRAISELGRTSVNIIENWKAGYDLEELRQSFGGEVTDNSLVLMFDRALQPTDDSKVARYKIVFSASSAEVGFDTGVLLLLFGDEVLIDWEVGRYIYSETVHFAWARADR